MLSERPVNPGALVQLPSLLQAAILRDWRQNWAGEQLLQKEIEGWATPEYLAAHSLGQTLDSQAIFAKAAALMQI
jgi:hypothetical protein